MKVVGDIDVRLSSSFQNKNWVKGEGGVFIFFRGDFSLGCWGAKLPKSKFKKPSSEL